MKQLLILLLCCGSALGIEIYGSSGSGSVTGVTASGPLSSSGGTSPNIALSSVIPSTWLPASPGITSSTDTAGLPVLSISSGVAYSTWGASYFALPATNTPKGLLSGTIWRATDNRIAYSPDGSGILTLATTDQLVTFPSSITANAGIGIPVGQGIASSLGGGTHSVTGTLFFISSNSIVGSTWTSATSTMFTFSTYTMAANELYTAGDEICVECMFYNGNTPSSPQQGLYNIALNAGNVGINFAESQITTANKYIETNSCVMVSDRPGFVFIRQWERTTSPLTGGGDNAAQATTILKSQYPFVTTGSQVFSCRALATAGSIGFVYMKAYKR